MNGTASFISLHLRTLFVFRIGISPVTVVTHRDKLSSPAEREAALKQAAAATGSTRCNTFLIANYCHDNSTRRAETEIEAFQILHAALAQAETFVKNFKQERREQAEQALIEARSKPCKGVGEGKIRQPNMNMRHELRQVWWRERKAQGWVWLLPRASYSTWPDEVDGRNVNWYFWREWAMVKKCLLSLFSPQLARYSIEREKDKLYAVYF